ncbi:uncharacterized protein LOC125232977 [Leguminivora glycinivorella]|uniref:uncharacterized protein LOC125232977 n=1 Tax=Leguminivora glycinivorella TaxID=1035111 RepID=UPI00200FAAA9|nr:uncharacterized protein LOC125232977 [Leguminivora glycinivorella]
MKVAVCLFALVALVASAPQPRKDFHEHFQDFLDLIMQETGDQIEELMTAYREFDDFNNALSYMQTAGFKDIVQEMESLPEFQAVVGFLEADNIDITFFLDILDKVVNAIPSARRTRQASGTSLTSFIQDSIALFPKEKLDALFQQKKEEDEEFKSAIDNLFSDEWRATFSALLDTPQFQQEADTLLENGIDLRVFADEILAVFGQN